MLKKSLTAFLFSKAHLHHINKASFALYKPLPNYQSALGTMTNIFSQEEIDAYNYALTIYSSRSDTNHFSQDEATSIFPTLFMIGRAHLENTKNVNEGLKWYNHALMFGDKADLAGNLAFAMLYQEMDTSFSSEKLFNEAIKCAEKALAIYNSTELDDDQIMYKCACLFKKALNEREKKDLNAAAQSLVEFVTILEGLSNPENAENLISGYETFVDILYQSKHFNEAHKYAKRALELMDKTLGKDNFRGHNLAEELACTLFERNRVTEALVYANKWENMLRKEYQEADLNMVTCYFLQGQLLLESKQYASALNKFEQAEKVVLVNPKARFADSGAAYIYKAECHFHLARFKEAQENFDKAVQYNTERFGPNSKPLADCYYGGAKIFQNAEKYHNQAKELYFKSLEMYRNLGQAGIFETWSTLVNFSEFLFSNGMVEEGVNFAKEALEICNNNFSDDLPKFESSYNFLGMAQFYSGDFEAALENLQMAAKICEDLGNSSGKLVSHYFNLLKAYVKAGQNEQAEVYGRKILEMTGKGTWWAQKILERLEPVFSSLNKQKEFEKLQATYL